MWSCLGGSRKIEQFPIKYAKRNKWSEIPYDKAVKTLWGHLKSSFISFACNLARFEGGLAGLENRFRS